MTNEMPANVRESERERQDEGRGRNRISGFRFAWLLYSVILPTLCFIIGSGVVMDTVNGKGDTLGFRGLGLYMMMPVITGLVVVCNLALMLLPLASRRARFLVGLAVPALTWVMMLVFLWHGYWDGRPN